MAAVARVTLFTIVLAALTLFIYWKVTTDERSRLQAEVARLEREMAERIAAHQAMIERLSRGRRLAHVHITDQAAAADGQVRSSSILFIELDENGAELARQTFTVPGDVLFIDAWTAKFDHERVAEGHPLQGQTLILLRRIYSDALAPAEGFTLDVPGAVPPGYAAGEAARFEQNLWKQFWHIAGDADVARAMGVRVAQGEAVYKKVRAGQAYELTVDAAGGMNLIPLDERGDESP